MNHYTFSNAGKNYKRISKTEARKQYIAGNTIVMIANNLRPFTQWHNEFYMNRKDREQFIADETGVKNDFNNYVNSFEYYNCINSETGKYAAFYIAE